jgi:hypothetical protein
LGAGIKGADKGGPGRRVLEFLEVSSLSSRWGTGLLSATAGNVDEDENESEAQALLSPRRTTKEGKSADYCKNKNESD